MEMRKLVLKNETKGVKRGIGKLVCLLVNNKDLVLDILGAGFLAIMTYICLLTFALI